VDDGLSHERIPACAEERARIEDRAPASGGRRADGAARGERRRYRTSYHDACGIARALDVVGERWALLVVRELLLGPQRFGDLRRALRAVSSNLLTDRLRELEGHGVVSRRTLPPPAGAVVYQLTESGRELEPAVLALGGWGLRVPMPASPTVSATSVLLFLRGSHHHDPTEPPATCAIELGDRTWTVSSAAGRLHIQAGEPAVADARLRTDPATLNTVLAEPAMLDNHLADGSIAVDGDLATARRLLGADSS
jgi:DNA-binding HxlR family transcriptional regulator